MEITKYVLPVVVGAMGGMILITFGEMAIHKLYPLLPGTDLYDADSVAKYFKQLPANAFMLLLSDYIICAFIAGVIATLVGGRDGVIPALVVGTVLSLAGLYKVINLPQPLWFSIISMLVFIPFALLGYQVARRKPVAA